jgi:hypothetical protein
MLIKDYLSKMLNSVSAFAAVLILSGFVYTTPSWAMEEDKSENGTHATPLMSLPDEILLKIMSYKGMPLKEISLVSKRFHAVSCDETLTRPILIDTPEKLEKALSNSMNLPFSIRKMKVNHTDTLGKDTLTTLVNTYPPLTSLDLSGNTITKEGALALFTALQNNHTLTSLDLERTLNDDTCEGEVYTALGRVITNNSSLRVLNLSDNWMNRDGLAELCKALPSSHIEILDLSHNCFSTTGFPLIAGILKGNSPLKELNLSHNVLNEEDFLEIASALKENTSLEKLWMVTGSFEPSRALAFSEAIQNHPTLKFLSLRLLLCSSLSEEESLRALRGKERNIEVKVSFGPYKYKQGVWDEETNAELARLYPLFII